jgi:hypothetical protein
MKVSAKPADLPVMRTVPFLLLALKGPPTYACQCLLIGHDQTC